MKHSLCFGLHEEGLLVFKKIAHMAVSGFDSQF